MILDTNAISALLEDDEALHARIAAEPALYLPVIAIGEFRFGLLGSRLREPLTEKLAALIRQSVIFEVTEATTLANAHPSAPGSPRPSRKVRAARNSSLRPRPAPAIAWKEAKT